MIPLALKQRNHRLDQRYLKKVVLSLVLILGLNIISQVEAGARQTIRFYKVNKQIQADRIKYTKKKASKPGCHNFRKKARIFKAVQIGYSQCSVYAKKGCAGESIITVSEEDPIKKQEEAVLRKAEQAAAARKAAKKAAARKAKKRTKNASIKVTADDSNTVSHAESTGGNVIVEPDIVTSTSTMKPSDVEDRSTPERSENDQILVKSENLTVEPAIDETLTQEMTEGIAWYPVSEHRRGVKVGSWNCSLTAKQSSD
jgi:hypothetical protein